MAKSDLVYLDLVALESASGGGLAGDVVKQLGGNGYAQFGADVLQGTAQAIYSATLPGVIANTLLGAYDVYHTYQEFGLSDPTLTTTAFAVAGVVPGVRALAEAGEAANAAHAAVLAAQRGAYEEAAQAAATASKETMAAAQDGKTLLGAAHESLGENLAQKGIESIETATNDMLQTALHDPNAVPDFSNPQMGDFTPHTGNDLPQVDGITVMDSHDPNLPNYGPDTQFNEYHAPDPGAPTPDTSGLPHVDGITVDDGSMQNFAPPVDTPAHDIPVASNDGGGGGGGDVNLQVAGDFGGGGGGGGDFGGGGGGDFGGGGFA
jgi:hypothetical protein